MLEPLGLPPSHGTTMKGEMLRVCLLLLYGETSLLHPHQVSLGLSQTATHKALPLEGMLQWSLSPEVPQQILSIPSLGAMGSQAALFSKIKCTSPRQCPVGGDRGIPKKLLLPLMKVRI